MEYSPPPLFKQGASARAKMVFFALIALILLGVDSHMRSLAMVRQVISTALYPLQVVALAPRDALYYVGDYFSSLADIKAENEKLKLQQTVNARTLQQGQQLLAENIQLRHLLGTAERLPVKSVLGEILYDTRDAFTRKIVLDRGLQHGVALGQPVIDHIGVVGQVTRVFPFTSEVTLLTDKNQAIPVQVVRNGLRSVAYGRGQSNVLDLRFMPTNADIQKGDTLVTSGIDGVYPPGLAVATVSQVENKSADSFARIMCQPTAGIDRNRQLLILLTENKLAPRPVDDAKEKNSKAAGILRHAASRTNGTSGRGIVEAAPAPTPQPATSSR
ncbi:rod shape-determining protein MreC [Herminiimonas fonticola]|uniref:rod shape-determining protein MreC n=1 Tax=Herminiimonas fonticola TaxID=303380 RepID=UPI003340A657